MSVCAASKQPPLDGAWPGVLPGLSYHSYFHSSLQASPQSMCLPGSWRLVSLLYHKTLELSIVSADPSASLTLMSSDIQRIVDPLVLLHDTWGGFIELGLGMFLLYRNLGGNVVLAPAAVYLLSILSTSWVISVIAGFQKRWFTAIQTRVSFTSALLHSMRNAKLLGMSSIVRDRTQALREKEINECKRYRNRQQRSDSLSELTCGGRAVCDISLLLHQISGIRQSS